MRNFSATNSTTIKAQQYKPKASLDMGRTYHAEVSIGKEWAALKVDGEIWYSCKLKAGYVAFEGKFGFVNVAGQGRAYISDIQAV